MRKMQKNKTSAPFGQEWNRWTLAKKLVAKKLVEEAGEQSSRRKLLKKAGEVKVNDKDHQ